MAEVSSQSKGDEDVNEKLNIFELAHLDISEYPLCRGRNRRLSVSLPVLTSEIRLSSARLGGAVVPPPWPGLG